ncbi:MAG TPA: hypothetical protein VGX48_25300, partial [Pyrinomonadaceae bacterium]|nr:hypothetical protein [Pyrinomonadaceae bacterium]
MSNRVVIEVAVDEDGKASAALHSLEGDVLRFTAGVNRAGTEGMKLRDVFAGNVLADFFQRGITGAVQFGASSVQAAAVAEDSNRRLEFTATRAGISYTKAAEAAEDFGRRVGASNTEAARTLSDLVRLAERAGRPGDVEQIQQRFADLAAAQGLKGGELSELIGTILSGQDEGLNKLGLPDPSKLYAQYAASIGKTADALTEMEKARAALNAVEAKGAEAAGQADARLLSTAGKIDTAAASYENLKAQTGEAITTSIEFRDVLDTVRDALGSLVTSHAEARRELALGLKSPEQIAQEERDGIGRQVFNAGKGALTALFAVNAQVGGGALLLDQLGIPTNTFDPAVQDAIYNPGQRQYEARVEQLRALKAEIEKQEADAKTNAGASAARAAAAAARSALQQQFGDNLEAATKEQDLNARLGKLKELREELRRLPDVLDATEFEKRSKKIDEAIRETAKQVAAAVRTARDAARDLLGDAIIRADDNPFT